MIAKFIFQTSVKTNLMIFSHLDPEVSTYVEQREMLMWMSSIIFERIINEVAQERENHLKLMNAIKKESKTFLFCEKNETKRWINREPLVENLQTKVKFPKQLLKVCKIKLSLVRQGKKKSKKKFQVKLWQIR